MDKLIYYPGFEFGDAEWTKFALLYLDRLSPIIPVAGDKHLSEAFRKLRDETDLIDAHRPSDFEGYNATLDALGQLDRILTNPERYERVFKHRDIVSTWKRDENQKFELFGDSGEPTGVCSADQQHD